MKHFYSILFLLLFINIKVFSQCIVDAGPDFATICADASAYSLNGSVTGGTGGIWTTTGTGVFSPDNTTLNADYMPSAADISAGNVFISLNAVGCGPMNDSIVIYITPAPTANAGPDQSRCANNAVVTLTGTRTVATASLWTTAGSGGFANANNLNTTYTPSAADITAGTVTLTLTTTAQGTCNPVSDQIVITLTPAPEANANFDQTICSDASGVSLDGSVTNATGGIWSGGTGTFAPNATTLNATYIPSAADISAGFVDLTLTTTGNGICNPVTDSMLIIITPAPTANAGPDQTVCGSANLNGTVTVATGGTWSGGAGVFSPDQNTLNATYTPSAAEIAAGTVTLTLTSTGNGTCNPVSDNMVITISSGPTVNAGPDQTVCGSANLSGSVTVATGGTWSGGAGVFNPDQNTLNATYTPSAAEIASGTVTLTLTSTGNGTCSAVSDDIVITINSGPTVNAGTDQTICGNQSVSLNGSVTVATGGTWSGGAGIFTPDQNTLNATYTPSAAEIAGGMVTLTLTSTGNGLCNPVSDAIVIAISPSPTVNAGPDQTVCGNQSVTLTGTVTVATGGTWSGGAGVFNPDANTLNVTYTPSAAEIAGGTVTLTLTSTGNGTCNPVSDNIVITIMPAPTVNAGTDQTICANQTVTLSGTVSNASGGIWTTSGTGTFSPNANTLNASYTPSTTDKAAGSVTLTLTSTGNGGCNPVSDNVVITLTNSPTVNAGANQAMNAGGVTLNGAVTVATGGMWSTTGSGVFAPNAFTLNATYTPSAGDIAAGTITLTLTTTGNGACSPVSDNMVLTGNAAVCNVTITTTATNNSINFSAANNDGTSIGSYFWDFGDGSYASGKVQNHVYASAGSYNASVFYTTPDSSCTATEYKLITITAAPISTFSMSGTISAGVNTLDFGVVSLFKLTNFNYDLLLTKTLSPSDNGSFSFSNLANGYYLLHTFINPSSSYFNNYLASYSGDVITWGTAVVIQVNNGNLSSQNINLVAYTCPDVTWNTGSDTINGVITFDESVVFRTAGATENPVENALVSLYNSNGDLLTSVYTDAFGNYGFGKLIAGSYTIKVEYAGGVTPTSSLSVSVDGNPATVNQIDTEVLKQAVTLGMSNTTTKVSDITMYPNPVASELSIELPADASGISTLYIYDAVGQLKYRGDYSLVSGDKLTVETNNLTAGFYIIEMVIGEKLYKGKIIKK